MKLEDLERDILGAYLNYQNNDLKTTVKQLDMSANSLLKDDKTLDPVWTNISKNVYIAVILNNFSKGIEFSLKDLENMLNNQNIVYSNIIEFCNKFENSEEISFATSLKKISANPLKSAIQILKENIEKMNILSVTTLDNNNIASAENKTEKITQCDIIEIVDKKAKATRTYDIKTNVRNVVTKMDISYLQDGKEIQEERIVFAFDIVDISEEFITIKTNPMCEVKDGKINLNRPETIFKLTKNGKLCLHTPTMDGGFNFELIIKEKNLNGNETTPTNEQLIEELSNYIKNNSGINILEDWYSCKNTNPQFKEFFDETEKEAIQELVRAQDKATILKHSLKSYISIPDPHRELGLNNLIITYFGLQSIYDRKLESDNGLFESLSIDNVGLFRATLVINIVAIMYHISDNSLPMGLKIIFERKEFVNILGPIVKEFLPTVIPSINEIKFFYKQ
ncbi:MAG: hypothetical protein U0M05_07865 [Clostridia bacterium]|jgi:hypothetical protein|nr:hypothetical protein [Clostridia bacterium]